MIQNRFASARVKAMPKSMFALMDDAKMQAKARGLEIIDLSIGSSDLSPPSVALDALRDAVRDSSTYGYCLQSGTKPLRDEVAVWYEARYKQKIDADSQVLPLIGSQEGLANLLFALTDPEDSILLPDPAYPSYFGAVAAAGLKIISMPLLLENQFLPDLTAITAEDAKRAKVMVISYPNNPTAAVATPQFMQEVVSFCKDHKIVLIHDFPYVDMVFDEYEAPSILNQKGGLELGVELYSCSKSYHMGGFRMGWAIGNEEIIAALAQLKSAIDFNQYVGIQRAAIAALKLPRNYLKKDAAVFQARRDSLVNSLRKANWQLDTPQASMYVWAQLPKGSSDSFDFCVNLAKETGVCLAPGRGFGQKGEGYVRFALVREEDALTRAVERVQAFLA